MKISLEWLNEYVDITDLTVEQIVHELTMSGLEVEGVETTGAKFTNIVTAKIEKISDIKGNIIARWGGTCGRWDIA